MAEVSVLNNSEVPALKMREHKKADVLCLLPKIERPGFFLLVCD